MKKPVDNKVLKALDKLAKDAERKMWEKPFRVTAKKKRDERLAKDFEAYVNSPEVVAALRPSLESEFLQAQRLLTNLMLFGTTHPSEEMKRRSVMHKRKGGKKKGRGY